jgi:hypothetical protein
MPNQVAFSAPPLHAPHLDHTGNYPPAFHAQIQSQFCPGDYGVYTQQQAMAMGVNQAKALAYTLNQYPPKFQAQPSAAQIAAAMIQQYQGMPPPAPMSFGTMQQFQAPAPMSFGGMQQQANFYQQHGTVNQQLQMPHFGGNPFFGGGTFGGHYQASTAVAPNPDDLSSASESPVQRNARNAHYASSSSTSGESYI